MAARAHQSTSRHGLFVDNNMLDDYVLGIPRDAGTRKPLAPDTLVLPNFIMRGPLRTRTAQNRLLIFAVFSTLLLC
jgi:hypothetical protein